MVHGQLTTIRYCGYMASSSMVPYESWTWKDMQGSGRRLIQVISPDLPVGTEHLLTWVLTHGAEPFLRSRQLCSHSRTSQHFTEPEGSTPCSQEPSTDPILSHINPIYTIPSYLSKINFNPINSYDVTFTSFRNWAFNSVDVNITLRA
jgi:hypothetical protein